MQLYAVRVFVTEFDRACDFYGATLGLTERFRSDDAGWAEYEVGGPVLGIERISSDDVEGRALVGRFLGVSLEVDDMDAVCARLAASGVMFTGPPARQPWGGTLAHLFDPDRNVLTLLG